MEAIMNFGAKPVNVRVPLRTNMFGAASSRVKLSPSPTLLFHNLKFSRKPSTQFRAQATTSSDPESSRPLTTFTPSLWGDHFLSLPDPDKELEALSGEIHALKCKVRDMLVCPDVNAKQRIRLIYLLVSLGLSYHFENEIQEILKHAFEEVEDLFANENDLFTVSTMFEVFRLYGHKMPCDVFRRFKGDDGKFKKCLVSDIKGMLSLYEVAHLRTTDEDILEEALSFTSSHLESLASQADAHLSRLIHNALHRPRYCNMEILVAREYISFHEHEEDHDEALLKFAKLNFNSLQLLYSQELKALSKWWDDLDLPSKLPYVRDRIVESHLAALGMYFEPQYSAGRIIVAKLSMIMVVVDDTCDAYATLPEVTELVDCVQRWDPALTDKLTPCTRIVFRSLFQTLEDIEKEVRPQGRSYSVQQTVAEIKKITKAYLDLAKWVRAGHVPTFEEYMEVGYVTAGMDQMIAYCLIGMQEIDEEEAFEWIHSEPGIIQALNIMFRTRNDIVSFEIERRRGQVVNGFNCYMKQHGVTKEAATEAFRGMYRDNHKIVMEELLDSTTLPRQLLLRAFALARLISFYYSEGDGYTEPEGTMEHHMKSLYVKPIPL